MRAVLLSIKPKYCELIANGKKTIEVRKTKPKLETPFKCYIYCTKEELLTKSHNSGKIYVASNKRYQKILEQRGNTTYSSKIIGEFVCSSTVPLLIKYSDPDNPLLLREFPYTGLTDRQIIEYLGNGKQGYGWVISNLVIYDKPKELNEFKKMHRDCWYADLGLAKRDCPECNNKSCFVSRPPQSWCYVEELEGA